MGPSVTFFIILMNHVNPQYKCSFPKNVVVMKIIYVQWFNLDLKKKNPFFYC